MFRTHFFPSLLHLVSTELNNLEDGIKNEKILLSELCLQANGNNWSLQEFIGH